jgi:hypothetical protein
MEAAGLFARLYLDEDVDGLAEKSDRVPLSSCRPAPAPQQRSEEEEKRRPPQKREMKAPQKRGQTGKELPFTPR